MRFKKGNLVIECTLDFLYNIYEREGFKPMEETPSSEEPNRQELIEKAKSLGVKSPHMMKTETLLERIK